MTITEAQRFEMHLGLRKSMGDDVANTLMEHLPPSGWTDVARKHDITMVEHEIALVKQEILLVKQEISLVKQEISLVKEEASRIERRLNILIASTLTFGLAIIVMLVQLQISIARL